MILYRNAVAVLRFPTHTLAYRMLHKSFEELQMSTTINTHRAFRGRLVHAGRRFITRTLRSCAVAVVAVTIGMASGAAGALAEDAGWIGSSASGLISIQNAEAGPARRAARRTVRRTVRRAVRRAYLRTLPVGCVVVTINAIRHWRCNSVYYRQSVVDGATVYVVVNP